MVPIKSPIFVYERILSSHSSLEAVYTDRILVLASLTLIASMHAIMSTGSAVNFSMLFCM